MTSGQVCPTGQPQRAPMLYGFDDGPADWRPVMVAPGELNKTPLSTIFEPETVTPLPLQPSSQLQSPRKHVPTVPSSQTHEPEPVHARAGEPGQATTEIASTHEAARGLPAAIDAAVAREAIQPRRRRRPAS